MGISKASLLSFSLSLIFSSHVAFAQFSDQGRIPFEGQQRNGLRSQCRLERLNAHEPTRRVDSEAGLTEYFDEDNEQFECAGVTAHRKIIQPRGLLLPAFYNAPGLAYIIKGRGIFGTVMPGCPESFQSFKQRQPRMQEGQGQFPRDKHQRVNRFREGDVIAMPAGVAHWIFNDGDQPIVAFTVIDTSNSANQLDENRSEFLLAGRKRFGTEVERTQGDDAGDNMLSGFDTESLSKVMGISRETAEKLKGRNDNRGDVVRVNEGGFQIMRPSRREEGDEYEYEEERGSHRQANGLEQAFCSMSIKHNIDGPSRADIYNPNAGRVTTLNSQKLTVLKYIRMNAVRGVLKRNAFVAPHWNVNAHSIMYVTGGTARVQIVGSRGNTAFDGELRKGQLIVVPQNFALLIQARRQEFEWVAIKTNDQATVSPIVGKTSIFKGMPEEVLRNGYRVSREEARRLKYNRGEEMILFAPGSSESRGRDRGLNVIE